MSGSTHQGRRRVLFVGEAVTLAHVSRPVTLAGYLDPARYDVHIAFDDKGLRLFDNLPYQRWSLHSIPPEQFLKALAKGSPLYDATTLRRYVADDLRLIGEVRPDVIVGDFRLSLGVSARLAKIPYIALTNAYWSPFATQRYTVPDLPLTKILGAGLGQLLFDLVRPLAFALHTRPLNRVRRENGLADLGYDLRVTYTDADVTLYADVPELIPTSGRSETHHYIGPVSWQPDVPLPAWWDEVPDDKPLVYVTLGTSGAVKILPELLETLGGLPVNVIAATAGRIRLEETQSNVFTADFLPGEDASKRADLVICNGGSPTTLQALMAGVPVIGVPSNLDQYLNMSYLEQAGAGLTMRPGRRMGERLRSAIDRVLSDGSFRRRAADVSRQMAAYPAERLFPELLERALLRRGG